MSRLPGSWIFLEVRECNSIIYQVHKGAQADLNYVDFQRAFTLEITPTCDVDEELGMAAFSLHIPRNVDNF